MAELPDDTAPNVVNRVRALVDIMNERHRQIEAEGWTPEHDDDHNKAELARAAACYAAGTSELCTPFPISFLWPWDKSWWKPSEDRRRNLVKAGALIIAEIERLDRLKAHGID